MGLNQAKPFAQAGSRVTLISLHSQLAANEDADVAEALLQLFRDGGIDVTLTT